jgi:hypothetical protein
MSHRTEHIRVKHIVGLFGRDRFKRIVVTHTDIGDLASVIRKVPVENIILHHIFDGDFPYDRSQITDIRVSDYYTLEAIPAKEAYYVLDPDVFGPMGHELVPFKTLKSAQTFKEEHHGKQIVRFDEITDSMVMALDGIVQ